MGKTTSQLYFDYPDISKIRIKKTNVLVCDEWPALYAIVTKKLAFTVPRVAVIMTKTHAYIPLSIYRDKLTQYYSSIKEKI